MYYFQVKMRAANKIFENTVLKANLTDSAEIIVTSIEHADYDSCVNNMQTFMLAEAARISSRREKYTIQWEKNPFIAEAAMDPEEEEKQMDRWYKNEVIKMHVVLEKGVCSKKNEVAHMTSSMYTDGKSSPAGTESNMVH